MSGPIEDTGMLTRQFAGDFPPPGGGSTPERHRQLYDIARRFPVSVARLVEAHADALAILSEAGREPRPSATYGVWASGGPKDSLSFDPDQWTITGTKPFCSGLGVVDRALVTVGAGAETLLLEVGNLTGPTVVSDTAAWSTPALADSHTGTVHFTGHPVESDPIGPPGWYLRRSGFWHGACGPAACWAGSAVALVDHAEALHPEDPHRTAHVGAMRSARWALEALLETAGRQIDADPRDATEAQRRALGLRHTVERMCTTILDRFSQAFGPRPFVESSAIAQRFADTHLYLRQDHAERDLYALGALGDP